MILLDEKTFKALFKEWYPVLCRFSMKYVDDPGVAEDLVQEVFVNLWNSKDTIELESGMAAYLYASAKYNCFRYLNKSHQEAKTIGMHLEKLEETSGENEEYLQLKRLKRLYQAVEQLPEKTKQVFRLSKMEGLTYQEISAFLGVSVKTVEKQMSAALKKLRTELITSQKSE